MEDLEGHRALVNYRYTLRDLLMAIGGTALYMFAVFGTLCLLYTSPSPRDKRQSRMPSSA